MVRHTGEDFIDVEGIAVSSVLPFQPSGIHGSKLDAPESDRFPSDDDPAFSQEIFDIAVTEIESVVEPDGVADDVGWESVAFVGIHGPILAIWPS